MNNEKNYPTNDLEECKGCPYLNFNDCSRFPCPLPTTYILFENKFDEDEKENADE